MMYLMYFLNHCMHYYNLAILFFHFSAMQQALGGPALEVSV